MTLVAYGLIDDPWLM